MPIFYQKLKLFFHLFILCSCVLINNYSIVSAKTLNVPSQYETIRSALDSASHGDIIEVSDGLYKGEGFKNIVLPSSNIFDITIKSTSGPFNCTIDCENDGRAFLVEKCSNKINIDGFTIINGKKYQGGGIFINKSSNCTILNCIFRNNKATWCGGGISSSGSSTLIINCIFTDNYCSWAGGALFNASGGGITIINNSNFLQNKSGSSWAGGIHTQSTTTVNNCIFFNNDPYCISRYSKTLNLNYSLVFEDSIRGTINSTACIFDKNPEFIDLQNHNFQLSRNSPCINAGSVDIEECFLYDIIGTYRNGIIDIGAFEYHSQTIEDDSDQDGVPNIWDRCPQTPENSYTDRYGCLENGQSAVSGQIFMKGSPLKEGSAMLIQSGEIHQKSIINSNGGYHFNEVAEDKPFSVIIRKKTTD